MHSVLRVCETIMFKYVEIVKPWKQQAYTSLKVFFISDISCEGLLICLDWL